MGDCDCKLTICTVCHPPERVSIMDLITVDSAKVAEGWEKLVRDFIGERPRLTREKVMDVWDAAVVAESGVLFGNGTDPYTMDFDVVKWNFKLYSGFSNPFDVPPTFPMPTNVDPKGRW